MVVNPDEPSEGPQGCSAPEEFAAFFKEHVGAVFGAVLAKIEDSNMAEDATAEAFARACAHWDDVVAGHPNPRAWVLKVAWNYHRSWWRTWGRRRAADPPEPKWPAAPPPVDPEVVEAIRSLPRGQREVFVLTALGELTPTEIAEVLGKAPETIRTHLHRARNSLRRALGEDSSQGRRNG